MLLIIFFRLLIIFTKIDIVFSRSDRGVARGQKRGDFLPHSNQILDPKNHFSAVANRITKRSPPI